MPKRNKPPLSTPSAKNDSENAKRIIMEERMRRTQTCQNEISAALQRHKCRIEATFILKAGQVIPQIEVIPNE